MLIEDGFHRDERGRYFCAHCQRKVGRKLSAVSAHVRFCRRHHRKVNKFEEQLFIEREEKLRGLHDELSTVSSGHEDKAIESWRYQIQKLKGIIED